MNIKGPSCAGNCENATDGTDPEEGVGEPPESDDGDADPPTPNTSAAELLSLPLGPEPAVRLKMKSPSSAEDGEEAELDTCPGDGVRKQRGGVDAITAVRAACTPSGSRDGDVSDGETEKGSRGSWEDPGTDVGPAVEEE
ncbi:hypothetical protein Ct61P_12207 [Colletotrichum tofieldiae]|nr:hypothetical protein Ct61P_12207 [Colletotrichum tofieldiae]